MSFHDTTTVGDLSLRDRITVQDDATGIRHTGTVTEPALLGDDLCEIRFALLQDDGTGVFFDREPQHTVLVGDG